MQHGSLPPGRAALVIGHAGHELRVHGWLEEVRPVVFVLTDGSGHGVTGRLGSTDRVVRAAGATPGAIYGELTDRQVYEQLVQRQVGAWQSLAERLAGELRRLEIEYVAADAAEGFNPTHDLCRYVTDAAVARVNADRAGALLTYEFDLDAAPDAESPDVAFELTLDAAALERKVHAGLGYPEMRGEVEAMLARFGQAVFARETFRHARSGAVAFTDGRHAEYERHGRERIARGLYSTLVTYDEHLAPVQAALQAWAGV